MPTKQSPLKHLPGVIPAYTTAQEKWLHKFLTKFRMEGMDEQEKMLIRYSIWCEKNELPEIDPEKLYDKFEIEGPLTPLEYTYSPGKDAEKPQ